MCRYFANNIKSSQIYICIFAVSPLQTLLLLFQLRIPKVFRIVDLSVNVYELKNLPIVLFFSRTIIKFNVVQANINCKN